MRTLEQLAVVYDLVVTAELGVLVGECVEAVWALGDDLLDAHRVERLDVLHGQHLEDVLVAAAASRVAGAHLAGPRMAKLTLARSMSLANACETFLFLSSKLPAQPTQ